jgi:hypothetical protein
VLSGKSQSHPLGGESVQAGDVLLRRSQRLWSESDKYENRAYAQRHRRRERERERERERASWEKE